MPLQHTVSSTSSMSASMRAGTSSNIEMALVAGQVPTSAALVQWIATGPPKSSRGHPNPSRGHPKPPGTPLKPFQGTSKKPPRDLSQTRQPSRSFDCASENYERSVEISGFTRLKSDIFWVFARFVGMLSLQIGRVVCSDCKRIIITLSEWISMQIVILQQCRGVNLHKCRM